MRNKSYQKLIILGLSWIIEGLGLSCMLTHDRVSYTYSSQTCERRLLPRLFSFSLLVRCGLAEYTHPKSMHAGLGRMAIGRPPSCEDSSANFRSGAGREFVMCSNVICGSRSRVLHNPETFVVSEFGEYRFDAPKPVRRARCWFHQAYAPDSGSLSATGRDPRHLQLENWLLQQAAV